MGRQRFPKNDPKIDHFCPYRCIWRELPLAAREVFGQQLRCCCPKTVQMQTYGQKEVIFGNKLAPHFRA
eukprot:NODE_4905_length_753_cov_2.950284_g4105_i0.p3 GENE.NODE_4905_length_753_cov_2.950284_g4105_i0~~NODE_4905_length_753_cov_2.950284_g4105_i0.p3  ORF type:complete len:69 (+),score=2.58 NODE_4905_length_753_cov_2.950284_g4105_i0:157-363(+)